MKEIDQETLDLLIKVYEKDNLALNLPNIVIEYILPESFIRLIAKDIGFTKFILLSQEYPAL